MDKPPTPRGNGKTVQTQISQAQTPQAQTSQAQTSSDLTLIDAYGYVFRAFYALPPMARSDGTPVGALYGFSRMLAQLLGERPKQRCLVVFDAKGKSFRNALYPAYKANRRETPPELKVQFPLVRAAAQAFSLPAVEQQGFEADDLIALYARLAGEKGWRVEVCSSDKDLMQLVDDGHLFLRDPVKGSVIDEACVLKRFGVPPDKVCDVMALAGDSSDNVPGVPGIGVKTAAELVVRFGDLESLLARTAEITQPKRREALEQHKEQARLSYKLVSLAADAPCPLPLETVEAPRIEREKLRAFFQQHEFRSLLRDLDSEQTEQGLNSLLQVRRSDEGAALSAHYSVETLTEREALEDFCSKAREQGRFALDVETTGLNVIAAELVGVALCVGARAAYLPLTHLDAQGQLLDKQIEREEALAILKPLLEDRATLKVGHNLKYDAAILKKYDLEIAPCDDTLLMSAVLDGGRHGHGLDELAERHLLHRTTRYKEVVGTGRNALCFDRVSIDVASAYAAEDAWATLRLHEILSPRLLCEGGKQVYETLERPLIPVIVAMERCGVRIDAEALHALSVRFEKQTTALEERIVALAGGAFLLSSPKQLGEVLFERLKLKGGKKTSSGQYATDSRVLEGLAAQGNEIAELVLQWRHISKLRSTYTEALPREVQALSGRIHTSFSLSGTQTGRLASSEPNLQNIPVRFEEGRAIRSAFVAEKGFALISLDYSQIELRLVAAIASVESMLESFAQGRDIHRATAEQMFNAKTSQNFSQKISQKTSQEVSQISKEQRRAAKAVNFGLLYGISRFGLSKQLGVSETEAQDLIALYFARYPQLRDYRSNTVELCRKRGYVETLFGRKIHLPLIADRKQNLRLHAERQAINAPIQGTAADIVKQAMIRIHRALQQKTSALCGTRMLLQVHDEIVLESPCARAKSSALAAQEIMQHAAAPQQLLQVDLEVDYRIGENWAA